MLKRILIAIGLGILPPVAALAIMPVGAARVAAKPKAIVQAKPGPYFHVGFNQVSGGAFWPIAGAQSEQQAGFIVPAIEHDAGPGGLCLYGYCPGIGWNPLNLGYIGDTSNAHSFLHGSLALGPSVQTGDMVKKGLRWACAVLPDWSSDARYSALKALLAPGQKGVYVDIGVYEAVPLNQLGAWRSVKPETLIGAALVKEF